LANHNTIVIGASAGGVAALQNLAARLDRGLPATIMVVIHLKGDDRSDLADILSRAAPLPATFAHDGQNIEISKIYLARRTDTSCSMAPGCVWGLGPRENHARPAIDPLFRSSNSHFDTDER
jgi:two-component system, chemotaxis family, protein-glutamate methylesterase/glutaminase